MSVTIELENRSGVAVDEVGAIALARSVLAAEGVVEGELGLAFVGPEEMRALKREHLGIDEATDVLAFPIDGRDELPAGVPRQLGDAVLCPHVVGDAWREPLVHGLLHLLGYEHGSEMETREAVHRRRAASSPPGGGPGERGASDGGKKAVRGGDMASRTGAERR